MLIMDVETVFSKLPSLCNCRKLVPEHQNMCVCVCVCCVCVVLCVVFVCFECSHMIFPRLSFVCGLRNTQNILAALHCLFFIHDFVLLSSKNIEKSLKQDQEAKVCKW